VDENPVAEVEISIGDGLVDSVGRIGKWKMILLEV